MQNSIDVDVTPAGENVDAGTNQADHQGQLELEPEGMGTSENPVVLADAIAAELPSPGSPPAPENQSPARNQGGGSPTQLLDRERRQPPPPPRLDANGNQLPPPGEDEEPPPHPLDGTPLPNVWIYAGEAYDLTDFIKKHPGGELFIGRTKNRDITALVNIFHPNPAKNRKMMEKYSLGRTARPEDIHPKYNAPAFLFNEGFNGWIDTPRYDFLKEDQLLHRIKARVNQPEMKQKVAKMDFWFDVVTVLISIAYVLLQVMRLGFSQYMPIYLFIPLMAALRISLAGSGHYFIHRPQTGFNKFCANVFDINYVPLALVVTDGHTLMHHPYTQTDVDIKQNVFTSMMDLPRYYRVPVHTVHKIGHVLTGMFARTIEIVILAVKAGVDDMYGSWQRGLPHFLGTFAMRFLLFGELIIFAVCGDFGAWLGQFTLTLWISTFMIVASHDFEDEKPRLNPTVPPMEPPSPGQAMPPQNLINWEELDWAVEQIKNSYDLSMIGNKYIDCFLSAGLSPHRVHHVLPQQKSGFANIISEDIVREEAEKFEIEWLAPKNFFRDRLPVLIKHYLNVPSRMAQEKEFGLLKEHFHPKALMTTLDYLIKGFAGIGSI
jgi:Cytochrome b5-like Heme/Steroid binding domain